MIIVGGNLNINLVGVNVDLSNVMNDFVMIEVMVVNVVINDESDVVLKLMNVM